MSATLKRSVRRRRPRSPSSLRPAPVSPARVVPAGLLSPPALIGVPLSVTLRHRENDTTEDAPNAPSFEKQALASARLHLRPSDKADDLHGFVALAVLRTLPRPPKFKSFEIALSYGYSANSIEEYLDPGDSYGDVSDGPNKIKAPLVILSTYSHQYLTVGEILPHIHAHDEALASWIVALLNSLGVFCECMPKWWQGVIGNAFWMGEQDEAEVVGDQGEDYTGPRLADYHKLVPEWVRTAPDSLMKDQVVNLRMAARAKRLGLDAINLFDPAGRRTSPTHLLRHLWIHHPCAPVYFAWRGNDIITQALDEDLNMLQQAGMDTSAFAGVDASDLSRAATRLSGIYAQLAVLDRFIRSLRAYAKHHKLACQ